MQGSRPPVSSLTSAALCSPCVLLHPDPAFPGSGHRYQLLSAVVQCWHKVCIQAKPLTWAPVPERIPRTGLRLLAQG